MLLLDHLKGVSVVVFDARERCGTGGRVQWSLSPAVQIRISACLIYVFSEQRYPSYFLQPQCTRAAMLHPRMPQSFAFTRGRTMIQ
jgi:hypothetical protein